MGKEEFDYQTFGCIVVISLAAIATSIVVVYLENSLVFYYFGFISFYSILNLTLYSAVNELASSILNMNPIQLKLLWVIAIIVSILTALEDIAHRCGLTILWLQYNH